MPTIDIGSHTCDIIESTTAASNGSYSFSTDEGTINGTIYKHIALGMVLASATVHLLQSQADATLYCVYAEDEPFWGSRAAPYPLQAAPFTQNIELGFHLDVRFQINGVYTDDANLTFVFTGYDVDSGDTCRFVWGGGEGVNLLTSARESAIVSDTVNGLPGTVKHLWPAQEELVFPCGEGAACQRYVDNLADYRDDSAETAAAGFQWYITACTMYYSGEDEENEPYAAHWDISLDGTATVCNYQHSTIHITGLANASVDVYTRSAGNNAFADGYYQSVALDGSGEGDLEDLPGGQYVLLGYAKDGEDFSHFAPPVTVDVGWEQTANAALAFEEYTADGDDLFWGYWMECPGVPLEGATVNCKVTVWDNSEQVDCYIAELGTTSSAGYGPTGHDNKEETVGELLHTYEDTFVDNGVFGGCQAENNPPGRPLRSLGARIVVARPALALLYAGSEEYQHLHGRAGGFRIEAGDYCPGGYTNVRMYRDEENGWLYSDPIPYMNGGTWDPCEDEDREDPCEWKVYAGGELLETPSLQPRVIGDTVHLRLMENDGGNYVLEEYVIGGRIRGAHVDWSGSELTSPPERPVDLGLQFGEYNEPAFRVIAEMHDPDDEDYGHSTGFVAHVCPYCGVAVPHDPADGAGRGICIQPMCGRDARAYWDVFPCAESDHRLYVAIPNARELEETRVEREMWPRPEGYDTTPTYRHSAAQKYRYLARHIQLGDWQYAAGFSAGTGMAAQGVVMDRTIGPAQAKIEVVVAPSEAVQVRVEAVRTDDTHLYYYGTVPADALAGDDIRFTHVLRTITDPEADRQALSRIYDADTEGWPCRTGDAVDSLVNAWAEDSNGDWQTVATWLSAGEWKFVNDGPSYRRSSILVTRVEVSPYSAHLWGPPDREPDIAIDWAAGFVHRVAINSAGQLFAQRLAMPMPTNVWRSTDTMEEAERTILDSAANCATPDITHGPDGRFYITYMRGAAKVRAVSADGVQTITEQ